jgi:hypothetical protein
MNILRTPADKSLSLLSLLPVFFSLWLFQNFLTRHFNITREFTFVMVTD